VKWRVLLGALACAALLAGSAAGYVAHVLHAAPESSGPEQVFEVSAGEPLIRIVERLVEANLVRGPMTGRALVWLARARGVERSVKRGEYALSAAMPPVAILEKLYSGAVITYAVTLPEGLHIEEIAERLHAAGIVDRGAFTEQARSPAFARALVEADSLEGYLYPETYRFGRDTSAEMVLRQMVGELFSTLTERERELIEGSGMTFHQVVTLASIVEKETGVAEERPLIAAVFLNRLQKRMRLQTDPTVIYGILRTRGSFDGNLKKADLREDSPYNTYTRGGLPPGPIANPGIDSIRAVLLPARVGYLYFVSRNDGTHYFSSTHRDHINAVNRYQRRGR
jgi:UPF0755 protein